MPKEISNLAKNIKRYKAKSGNSSGQVIKTSWYSLTYSSKIEIGATSDPRVLTIKKIANALEVSVNDLIK